MELRNEIIIEAPAERVRLALGERLLDRVLAPDEQHVVLVARGASRHEAPIRVTW